MTPRPLPREVKATTQTTLVRHSCGARISAWRTSTRRFIGSWSISGRVLRRLSRKMGCSGKESMKLRSKGSLKSREIRLMSMHKTCLIMILTYTPRWLGTHLKCLPFSTLFWWTWWAELTPCSKSTFKLGFSISRAQLQWEILTHLVSFSFLLLYVKPFLLFMKFVLIWVVFFIRCWEDGIVEGNDYSE